MGRIPLRCDITIKNILESFGMSCLEMSLMNGLRKKLRFLSLPKYPETTQVELHQGASSASTDLKLRGWLVPPVSCCLAMICL